MTFMPTHLTSLASSLASSPPALSTSSHSTASHPKKRSSCSTHTFNIFRGVDRIERVAIIEGNRTRNATSVVKGFGIATAVAEVEKSRDLLAHSTGGIDSGATATKRKNCSSARKEFRTGSVSRHESASRRPTSAKSKKRGKISTHTAISATVRKNLGRDTILSSARRKEHSGKGAKRHNSVNVALGGTGRNKSVDITNTNTQELMTEGMLLITSPRVTRTPQRPASASSRLQRDSSSAKQQIEESPRMTLTSYLRREDKLEDVLENQTSGSTDPFSGLLATKMVPSISKVMRVHSLKRQIPSPSRPKRPASALELRRRGGEISFLQKNGSPGKAMIQCKMCQKPIQASEFKSHVCTIPKHRKHTWKKPLWTRRAYYSINDTQRHTTNGEQAKSGELLRFTQNQDHSTRHSPFRPSSSPTSTRFSNSIFTNDDDSNSIEPSLLFTPPRYRTSHDDHDLMVRSMSVSPPSTTKKRPSSARIIRPVSMESSIRKQQEASPHSPVAAVRMRSAISPGSSPDSPPLHVHSHALQVMRESQREGWHAYSPHK